ncbi:MAG: ABC transporter substrate-binding protein [Verrucomicrobia bacterium]|nr:ABC transporter substrate-binding protein [Verrucomicrobiota bacterium]
MKTRIVLAAATVLFWTWNACAQMQSVVRFGHFPNVTHVQALVAHHLSRQGKGWFEERLGPGVKIEWYVYNAGPSAMEALFARTIDVTYVGPSPAINAFVKSRGEEVRIVAGAANGGAALVIQPDSGIRTGADFRGKRIATPQLGNTQDVACRAWLAAQGLKISQTGGDAQVLPTRNPDQLPLFAQKKLDAAWTVEPWVSRLVREAGGKIFLEEKDAVTTVLVSSVRYQREQREQLRKLLQAHAELTEWIKAHPQEAQAMVVAELSAETKSKISPELIASAWTRIELTKEVSLESLDTFVVNAQKAGFLRQVPDLHRLVQTP